MEEIPHTWTVPELAKYLRHDRHTIVRLCEEGVLEYTVANPNAKRKQRRITNESVQRYRTRGIVPKRQIRRTHRRGAGAYI